MTHKSFKTPRTIDFKDLSLDVVEAKMTNQFNSLIEEINGRIGNVKMALFLEHNITYPDQAKHCDALQAYGEQLAKWHEELVVFQTNRREVDFAGFLYEK